jgi:hypothetical protein
VRARLPVIEVPIQVVYPSRGTHFRVVRDPARIVARVLYTLGRRPPGLIRMAEAHPFPDGFPAPSRRGAR